MNFTGQKKQKPISKLVARRMPAVKIEPTPQALAERDELLAKAIALPDSFDSATNALAGTVVVELRDRVKAVGAQRMELTRPLDAAKGRLIEVEREYCDPLKAQIDRLQKAGGAYADAERKRVEAEEAERRKAAEALAKAETEQDDFFGVDPVAVAQAAETLPAVAAPSRAKGQADVPVLHVEITDKAAAFKARPDWFSVEPRMGVIKQCAIPAADRTAENPETTLYPGVKCWWERRTIYK